MVRPKCTLITSSCSPVTKATKTELRDSSGLHYISLCIGGTLLAVTLALPFTDPCVCTQDANYLGGFPEGELSFLFIVNYF